MKLVGDDFDRGDNADLGAAWDVMTGESAWRITSNKAVPQVLTSDSSEINNSVTWPADQYAQVKCTESVTQSTQGPGVCLRGATGSRTYYRFVISSAASNNVEVAKMVTGTYTQLALRTSALSAGDLLRGSVSGTTLTVSKNGSVLGATISDSAIASGRPGLSFSSAGSSTSADDWEAGNLLISPKHMIGQAVNRASTY